MLFKGTNDRKSSRPQDESALQRALEALLGESCVKTSRLAQETGARQDLARSVAEEARKLATGAPQTFYFLHDDGERFLVVMPTATLLMTTYAFLGIDVVKYCDDSVLWREFCDSAKNRPELTEIETEIVRDAAPRFGVLNPRWFAQEIAEGVATPSWKARFLGQNFDKTADYLGDAPLRWERYSFKIQKRSFTLTIAQPVSVPDRDLPSSAADSDSDAAPIPLPDFDATQPVETPDPVKTMIVRVAEGTIEEPEWRSLKPGDVLTTNVPADALFEALVDAKIVFRVKPGLSQGRPAVQIKEIF